jgi:hypothetical protein
MPNPDPAKINLCVDVETARLIPPDNLLLSIGACTIFEFQSTFSIGLQLQNEK